MKLVMLMCAVCLMATLATAGIPLPQIGDSQINLANNCRIPECPAVKSLEDRDKVHHLPYPLDCLLYVECRGSEAKIFPCPPDEVFDKNTSACGPRDKVRCVPCYQQAPLE
ncbi:uncharacterized protein LOC144474923 [Augochlora pura]